MDLDKFVSGMHNCLTDPVDILLEHGITLKQCDIRPANSLNTAFQLIAVNFQVQSLEQFGGISASHLDWTMVPYFRKSFFKHYIDGLKYVEGWSDRKIAKFKKKNFGIENDEDIQDENAFNRFLSYIKSLTK